ncbi:ribokinase [Rhodococcus sp. NPDC019627]|jgi:ribokinase|uniref:ribokinase n=1 Tax=unclassified Rhodococcus (in: high G+C Gram-positive bacteria) TaxID=192944 RepID=UPI00131F9C0D|nr:MULTISPECIES: ribokinase [unclassified Rhodococcus (in: high G+C Gram-positive bacteria)]QHE68896.1 Ribokinase [Rhodococcus sp. WAY2]
MSAPRIAVVGSVNMDLLTATERLPAPGETILGSAFAATPGGKGANQAIAAARAGGRVTFIGAVGSDTFALELRQTLVEAEVDTTHLREVDGPSGIATITVDAAGQNSIVVVPGANSTLTDLEPADLEAIAAADVLLCQLEIPVATVLAAAAHAAEHDTVVMLNPSPAQPLPRELVALVDVLVVNETEAAQLGPDVISAVPHLVTTLGGSGAEYTNPGGAAVHADAPSVEVVDTTGAGDAFAGALAVSWMRGPEAALPFATAAGALATTRRGASTSSPTRTAIETALHR